MRRILIIAGVLALFLAAAAITWHAMDRPPLRFVAQYGFPPAGGPTGRKKTIEGVTFVELMPGYFLMGARDCGCDNGNLLGRLCASLGLPWGRPPCHESFCSPPHWVEVDRSYWISATEITNEAFERFSPDHRRTDLSRESFDPVLLSRSDNAWDYCTWLSSRGDLSVRLPSPAEWENACRAGSTDAFCFGEDENLLGEYAWFEGNSGGRSHQVATRRPNRWGLFDLHGNAWEGCAEFIVYFCDPDDASVFFGNVIPRHGGSFLQPTRDCQAAGTMLVFHCGLGGPDEGLRLAADSR